MLSYSSDTPISHRLGVQFGSTYLSGFSRQDKAWDRNKRYSLQVADLYKLLGSYDRYAERMRECASFLKFKWQVDPESGLATLKLSNAHFCRVRHCPICQSRRSKMRLARFLKAFPQIQRDYPNARYLFLTVTLRNCPVEELRETVDHLNRSWQRLHQRKKFPAIGFIRGLEVTRSEIGEAHPHIHAVLMVNPSYFTHGYLNKAEWVKLWREALRVDYDPSVWVSSVTSKKVLKKLKLKPGVDPLVASIIETVKYSVKSEDLISDPKWLDAVTQQMHGVKSMSIGGVLKKYINDIGDEEPEDLIGKSEENDSLKGSEIVFGFHDRRKRYLNLVE